MNKQLGFAAAFAALAVVSSVSAAELPGPAVPDGLGVNIHFTDPRPGEMAMLADAGFTIVRMDFSWGATEREKGQYDFAAYDRLMAALAPHKIRALFILDYSNRHYDNNQSPASDEGRKAFARWAAAAADPGRSVNNGDSIRTPVLRMILHRPHNRWGKRTPNLQPAVYMGYRTRMTPLNHPDFQWFFCDSACRTE